MLEASHPRATLPLVLLAALFLAAPSCGHPTYAQLQAKLAGAQGDDRAKLLGQLAERDYLRARQAYEASQSRRGGEHLATMKRHSAAAMEILSAEAKQGKKDGMKQVEISFRKITFGLADLQQEVAYTDEPAVADAHRQFAALRAQVLQWMFRGKKKEP